MDKSLKCKARDTIKLLEENIGRTLFDINGSKILFDSLPRVMEIKTKIKKWFLIKLKSLCTAKETINKMKRQPSECEKIIANEATDKGLISKIYKQLIQLHIEKANNPIKSLNHSTTRKVPMSLNIFVVYIFFTKELSRWCSDKESTCQCRRRRSHRFNPWMGKIPWRRAWQLTPAFLPGESHGQRSLVGCSP